MDVATRPTSSQSKACDLRARDAGSQDTDWSGVGCGAKRAVADVSADADPYTGLAVHDTSPECEYQYEEAKVKHVLYWCTIGGTSVASPLIASVFALAGEQAKSMIGTFIAELKLEPEHGFCLADTGQRGHWTLWGRPLQLLDSIADIVHVEA